MWGMRYSHNKMSQEVGFKKINWNRSGDILEVIVRTEEAKPIYRKKVKVNDKKALRQIFDDLENMGVEGPQEEEAKWFESDFI